MRLCKGKALLTILILITLALSIGGGAYLWQIQPNQPVTPPSTVTEPSETTLPTGSETIVSQPTTVSPTPTDATAEWKTYSDARGFLIKYPPNWYFSSGAGPLIRFSNIDNFLDIKNGQTIVSLFTNTDVNFSSIQDLKEYYQSLPSNFEVTKDILVEGKKGFFLDSIKKNQQEVIFAGDDREIPERLFHIFVTYAHDTTESALAVFDQILATFKFLD